MNNPKSEIKIDKSNKRRLVVWLISVFVLSLIVLASFVIYPSKPIKISKSLPAPKIPELAISEIAEPDHVQPIQKSPVITSAPSATSKPYLTRKNIPEIRFSEPFAQHLAQLQAAYESGDLEAGYVLALNLKICYFAPHTKDKLDQKLSYWNDTGNEEEVLTGITDELVEDHLYCHGITKDEAKKYFELLSAVAEQGYPPAQAMYGLTDDPNSLGEAFLSQTHEERDQHFTEYRQKSHTFFNQSAQSGDLNAMYALVDTYRYGTQIPPLPKSPFNALIYCLAILELTDDPQRQEYFSQLRHEFESQLSHQEITQAMTQTSALVQQIMDKGIIYQFR